MSDVDILSAAFLAEMERTGAALQADYEKKREKAAIAQAAADASKEKLETWERAKATWLELHPDARPVSGVDAGLLERFKNLSTRDMLIELARENHGILRVGDAAGRLTAAGLFKDERNASKNVSTALYRSEDIFTRIDRGRYRLVEHLMNAPAAAAPHPISQPEDDASALRLKHSYPEWVRAAESLGDRATSTGTWFEPQATMPSDALSNNLRAIR
jgi:hypothetical protein